MSFIDNNRDRFSHNRDDDYYDDQDYDDDYYNDDNAPQDDGEGQKTGLLGNSRRPEPESVSVYTRSGRPLGSAGPTTTAPARNGTYGNYHQAEQQRPVTTRRSSEERGGKDDEYERVGFDEQHPARDVPFGTSGAPTPGDIGGRAIPRASSGKLPPYVLKPAAYDDVQMVVRRVRTNQPVVLVFRNTNIEAAKRILDFSFGLAMGVGGQVQELGDRVFVVLPANVELSKSDIDKLVADGDLVR